MNNLRILLYVIALSLAACHPEGTNVNQGLDKAAQLRTRPGHRFLHSREYSGESNERGSTGRVQSVVYPIQ